MPRHSMGARLYLDKSRRMWVIREGTAFVRTGLREDERATAEQMLEAYLQNALDTAAPGENVYFIRAGNRIKIGRSIDVRRRFESLQRTSPVKLTLLWAQPGGSEIELGFHRRFAECRSHGEWFEIRGPVAVFLQSVGVRGIRVEGHGTDKTPEVQHAD